MSSDYVLCFSCERNTENEHRIEVDRSLMNEIWTEYYRSHPWDGHLSILNNLQEYIERMDRHGLRNLEIAPFLEAHPLDRGESGRERERHNFNISWGR